MKPAQAGIPSPITFKLCGLRHLIFQSCPFQLCKTAQGMAPSKGQLVAEGGHFLTRVSRQASVPR